MSQLFAWGGQSIGVSGLASVFPMNTQDWPPLGWTGWISLQSKVFLNLKQKVLSTSFQSYCVLKSTLHRNSGAGSHHISPLWASSGQMPPHHLKTSAVIILIPCSCPSIVKQMHPLPSLHSLVSLYIFPGGSDCKESACNTGDPGSTPRSGKSPGGGNGNPLQYSCLKNSRDGLQSMGLKELDTTEQLNWTELNWMEDRGCLGRFVT